MDSSSDSQRESFHSWMIWQSGASQHGDSRPESCGVCFSSPPPCPLITLP